MKWIDSERECEMKAEKQVGRGKMEGRRERESERERGGGFVTEEEM